MIVIPSLRSGKYGEVVWCDVQGFQLTSETVGAEGCPGNEEIPGLLLKRTKVFLGCSTCRWAENFVSPDALDAEHVYTPESDFLSSKKINKASITIIAQQRT